jgi:diaminopimelate epimerase
MRLSFWKYQGTGNDFILFDDREGGIALSRGQIARLCDRHFGIGADGLMLLQAPRQAGSDFHMVYFNADGGLSSFCGNGGRCIAAFARSLGLGQGPRLRFEAADGMHEAEVEGESIRLKMNPIRGFRSIGPDSAWLDSGSPHLLRFVQGVEGWPVVEEGRRLRHDPAFEAIGGTNVNFVEELSPARLLVRTYERGVEDETLSCGTGVTASAWAWRERSGRPDARVSVLTRGGELAVAFVPIGEREEIWLEGPALPVFEGSMLLPPPLPSSQSLPGGHP